MKTDKRTIRVVLWVCLFWVASLKARGKSNSPGLMEKDPLSGRVLEALRREFGGHAVLSADK